MSTPPRRPQSTATGEPLAQEDISIRRARMNQQFGPGPDARDPAPSNPTPEPETNPDRSNPAVDPAASKLDAHVDTTYQNSPTVAKEGLDLRLDFPSLNIFYSAKEIFVRTFEVADLIRLHRAHTTGSLSLVLDALNHVVSIDVRDMTVPDFKFLQYWERLNSYPTAQMKFNWTSKYGNDNTMSIGRSDLQTDYLDDRKDAIQAMMREHGFVSPTMRDMELSDTFDWEAAYGSEAESIKWAFTFAQYLPGDSFDEKMKELTRRGVACIPDVQAFSLLLDAYGVKETITLRDENFDRDKWLAALDQRIENMQEFYLTLEELSPSAVKTISIISSLETEKLRVEGGGTAEPEERFLGLELQDLFTPL